jgi:hypothetical protein
MKIFWNTLIVRNPAFIRKIPENEMLVNMDFAEGICNFHTNQTIFLKTIKHRTRHLVFIFKEGYHAYERPAIIWI